MVANKYAFFFFSSRRRHTRYIGDWSSDVCSSDLAREFTRAVGAINQWSSGRPRPPKTVTTSYEACDFPAPEGGRRSRGNQIFCADSMTSSSCPLQLTTFPLTRYVPAPLVCSRIDAFVCSHTV